MHGAVRKSFPKWESKTIERFPFQLLVTESENHVGNVVAETLFLALFSGVAKLGNMFVGSKICVWEAKMFFT